MKTTKTLLATLALSAGLLAATGANATLVSALGGQVINDTDLNVTWAANANLAATNTFGLATGVNLGTEIYSYQNIIYSTQSIIYSDGRMTWGGAQKWLTAMNTANYLGYHDWRLPTTTDTGAPGAQCTFGGTDCGYNSTGSEMSHLFFTELGNKSYYNTAGAFQSDYGLVNTGSFTNFQSNYYWSTSTTGAWLFNTANGGQSSYIGKDNYMFALAVRSGQVAAVPVPAAAWLMGSGLLGLIGVTRRKAA